MLSGVWGYAKGEACGGFRLSTIEAKMANLGSKHLEAAVERYAADLAQAVGAREAAELMIAAALLLFYRAEGGEKTTWFARRCYWCAVEEMH